MPSYISRIPMPAMWTGRSILGEAVRNLRPVHLLITLLVAGVLVWAGCFEASSVDRSIVEFHNWVERGGMVFTAERENGIPAVACQEGEAGPSVLASGAAGLVDGRLETITFDRSPKVPYSVIDMSRGAVMVTAGQAPAIPGWIIGQTALDELGLAPGNLLRSRSRMNTVSLAVGTGDRQFGYDRDVIRMVPSDERLYHMCWVELQPVAFGHGPGIIAGFLPYDDLLIRPFRRTEPTDHPLARHLQRPSRQAWIPAGIIIGILWIMWWWINRRQFALYRSLHMPPSGVMLLALGESSIITGAAAAIAALAVTLSAGTTSASRLGVWIVSAAVPVGLMIATVGAAFISWRNLARAAKDL